ncbi:MAG TPA: serine/threonine-protein kinase [Polyangiaceae bacterium]
MSQPASSIDPSLPQVGELLAGKYRIERVLGQGGMGIVYAANHELLSVQVAIKLLLGDIATSQEAVTRFMNEARSAMKIQSENVARVMDVGYLENGKPYMVVEFLDGDDLAKLLEQRGVLSTTEAIDYTLQALEALAQAHSIGIVHRDLKPANLFLLKRQDKTMQVKVLDFGISKATNPLSAGSGAMTSTKALLGSPYYMSPEQLRSSKSVDARADIWSIGIILFELMTGQPPFLGDNFGELFAAILETDAPSLRAKRPDVSPQLEHVVLRCLQRKPDNRYSNVGELAQALAPFASTRGQRTVHRILDVMPIDGSKLPSVAPPGATRALDPSQAAQFQPVPQFQSTPQSYGSNPHPMVPPPGASTGSGVYSAPGLQPGMQQTNNSWTGAQALPPPSSSSSAGLYVGIAAGFLLLLGAITFAFVRLHGATATEVPPVVATNVIPPPPPASVTATPPPPVPSATVAAVDPATTTTAATSTTPPPPDPQQTTKPPSGNGNASTHHHDPAPTASATTKPSATASAKPPATAAHPAGGGGFDPFGGGAH